MLGEVNRRIVEAFSD
jgi:1-pyrroline-5-carboxylate dehydrogenase